jgi:hypothetical protein
MSNSTAQPPHPGVCRLDPAGKQGIKGDPPPPTAEPAIVASPTTIGPLLEADARRPCGRIAVRHRGVCDPVSAGTPQLPNRSVSTS